MPTLSPEFEAVIDEFTDRLNRGERPEIDEYAIRYPAHAAELREILEMLAALDPLRSSDTPRASDTVRRPESLGPPLTMPPTVPGFEVLGELGRGGMGVVYKVRQTSLNRVVALKMILTGAHATDAARSRFAAEASVLAGLDHPHVVKVFDFGTHDGNPYLALEFVEGGTLESLLAAGPLTPTAAARLAERIAGAITHTHEAGVIHRDLKPANVLLTGTDNPKVTDFGLARDMASASTLTATGAIVGTPSYMAPEQASGRGGPVGPAADVYALGAILYECLTGRPPFRGATVLDTLDQVKTREPVAVRELQPGVPRDLETICLKCLQKDPEKRYGTARDLTDDLRRFLDGRPIIARPVGLAERGWRWCRRNKVVAGLLVAVFGLLAVVVVGSVFAATVADGRRVRAEQAEDRERTEREKAERAKDREQAEREKAERNEDRAEQQLLFARLERARAKRLSGRQGQRHDALADLRTAVEVARRRNATAEQLGEIRDEYIGALALPDVRPGPVVKYGAGYAPRTIALSPDAQFYATGTTAAGFAARVYRVGSNELVASLPRPEGFAHPYVVLSFSPDGRYLTGDFHPHSRSVVWSIEQRAVVATSGVRVASGNRDEGPFVAFGRGEAALAEGTTVRVVSLATGAEARTLKLPQPKSGQPQGATALAYSPDGCELAVWAHGSASLLIYSGTADRPVRTVPAGSWGGNVLAWHPDGRHLATVGTDRSIVLWDTHQNLRIAVLHGHTNGIHSLSFHPNGQFLGSAGGDGTTRIWDVWRRQQVLHFPFWNPAPYFSADGRVFGVDPVGADSGPLLEFTAPEEFRTFGPLGEGRRPGLTLDGRLVFCAGPFQTLHLWDRQTGRFLESVPFPFERKTSAAIGTEILSLGPDARATAYPISYTSNDTARFGPPRPIPLPSAAAVPGPQLGLTDGRVITGVGLIYEPATGVALRVLPNQPQATGRWPQTAASPDGRLYASFFAGQSGVAVYDTRTGARLHSITPTSAYNLAFAPKGGQFITSNPYELAARDPKTWKVVGRRAKPGGSLVGGIATPPPAGVWAFETRPGTPELMHPADYRSLTRLLSPDEGATDWMQFTPDGGELLTNSFLSPAVLVWNLRAVRARLTEVGLDWDAPPIPVEDSPPVARVEVVGRELFGDAKRLETVWDAIDALELVANPFDVRANHRAMARALAAGDASRARARATLALAVRPDSLMAWEILARVGESPEARLAACRKCIELAPDQAVYRDLLREAERGRAPHERE